MADQNRVDSGFGLYQDIQEKLAEKMGTSTTPVREALLKLVSYGALDMEPAHPITVAVLNKEKYLENILTR